MEFIADQVNDDQILFQSEIAEVIDAMRERKVEKDEIVIKQGDDGDYFYVINE